MKTSYTIKNFRIFDSEGAQVELNPITLFTGCNSSGKSSIVKSLLLLCDYFSELKEDKRNGKSISLTAHKLDFTKKPHNLLGKFSKVVNNKSKQNSISMGMQVHSLMLGQDVYVELEFSVDEKDGHTNGYVSSIKVDKLDGTTIYSSSKGAGEHANLYSILPEFIRFVYTQNLICLYQSVEIDREMEGSSNSMSDEDFRALIEEIKSYFSIYKQNYGRSSLLDINRWNNQNRKFGSFLNKFASGHPEIIEKTKQSGILYYLPILDEKLGGEKDDCVSFLTSCLENSKIDRATACVIRKIVEDFSDSSHAKFPDYYKSWEKSYLTNFNKRAFLSKESSPKMFTASGMHIDGSQILMSPHNTKSSPVFLWDDSKEEELQPEKTQDEQIAEWEMRPLNFSLVFEAMVKLSELYTSETSTYVKSPQNFYLAISCYIEHVFMKFVEHVVEEIVVDATPERMGYVSSSIINVKRLYPLESNDEFTMLLKRYMEARRNLTQESDYVANSFMHKWIKKFEVGDNITINVDSEGLGITLRLHQNENDEGDLLADNGYGITQLFAILLNIEVAIMERTVSKKVKDNVFDALALKKEKIFSSPTIAIEEPEIHLHPRYQSLLTDMFFDAYQNFGVHFIIETHSEYLIRKSQILVANMKFESNNETEEMCPFRTYYVPKNMQPYSLGYRKDGKFKEEFGSGFYDEASNLAFELL